MTQAVFERHEKKFFLEAKQYQAFYQALLAHMQPDEYGLHTICTVYYDTEDFEIIRHCLDKPVYKEKLRLRSYGVPAKKDTVYLELKKKFRGVTYKRRVPMTLDAAHAYLNEGILPLEGGQNMGEINWFVSRHEIAPKTLLAYDRVALFGKEDAELRITFDKNIRSRTYNLDLSLGDYGTPLLQPGVRLMEVKTLKSMPCWLAEMLSAFHIYPASFSKYGQVYRKQLLHEEEISYVG